ncbi:MAG: restriction endonuclease [Anaerolineae bacterium]|nr:restriction endonuclease [Anaerolineae bacterium]
MPPRNYRRTVSELSELASIFWPSELSEEAAKLSVIPILLKTQDEFIAILGVPVPDLCNLFDIVNASSFSGNLFLKHLVILADFGGEQLQRVNSNFEVLFPSGSMEYFWNKKSHIYTFQVLPVPNLTNSRLSISSKYLLKERKLDELLQDVAAILIFGNTCINESTAEVLNKCEIGDYLGQPKKLDQFIKQRYIWVSRITMGSRSNNLGQLAQQFVLECLEKNLKIENLELHANGNIPGITHTNEQTNRPTTFDIVVSKNSRYVAIEVSFQVTTNSVIERKAGQAQARYNQIENAGHKITSVLDGAGNFQRESALGTICSYSHCTVAFSRSELNVLCEFIRGYLT